jgi:hypothetical protein
MIRLALLLILLASPALALELTYQSDQTGLLLTDDVELYLIDENGIPALTAVVSIFPISNDQGYIFPIPPGTEFDTCDPSVLATPILNDPTPFLFANDAASKQKFYAIPGQPWRTKLELIRYDDGNIDYSGFKFLTEFIPAVAVSTTTPYLLAVMTTVTETITAGVSSFTWLDWGTYNMTAFPYGYTQAQYFPLPDGWQVTFDPCTGVAGSLEYCRPSHGPWPSTVTGTDTDGVKTYAFARPYLYHEVINYPAGVPIPITATVIAQPGTIEISMTAEQTAKMIGWQGSLRLSVIYPEPPLIVTTVEEVILRDDIGRYMYTEADRELFGLGSVSREVAQYNYNPLNGLPMQFIP